MGLRGFDISNIKFKFDKDIVEWRIVLNGVSYNTGINLFTDVDNVASGREIHVIIFNESLNEGQNRINIYGKDSNGNWTPYEG